MKKETKEALYYLLDLMDMLGAIDFINIDINKANNIRKEVLDIFGQKNGHTILDSTSEELLGILPVILFDEKKFASTKDILCFAEKCLGISIRDYWLKRSRAEIVGIIINEVNKQNPIQFNKFLKAWSEFNNNRIENKEIKDEKNNKGFIEAWLEFFNSYKGVE